MACIFRKAVISQHSSRAIMYRSGQWKGYVWNSWDISSFPTEISTDLLVKNNFLLVKNIKI